MKKKYFLIIGFISLAAVLLVVAYNSPSIQNMIHGMSASTRATSSGGGSMALSSSAWTFEDVVTIAQHVVVAEFVTRRPFGEFHTEFEFIVHEQVIGETAETIFVYTNDVLMIDGFGSDALDFTTDTQYLLVLLEIANVYASLYDYGLRFITDLILDLNDPSRSTMNNESLSLHSRLAFDGNLTREQILSHVRSLPSSPSPTRMFITSENLDDIIDGSPYVVIVEIGEPWSLAGTGVYASTVSTDIYYATIVEVLKGDMYVGDELRIVFFGGTVFPGETHMVSIRPSSPNNPNSAFHDFTSRNSLHCMEQREEIIAIIRGPYEPPVDPTPVPTSSPAPSNNDRYPTTTDPEDEDSTDPIPTPTATPQPTSSPSPSPSPTPNATTEAPRLLRFVIGSLYYTNHNGETLRADAPPFITGNRAHIPLRIIAEALGADVTWNRQTRTGYMTLGDTTSDIIIDQPLSDGMGTPVIINNRTFVPTRYIAETFGAEVRWDRDNSAVYVYWPQ